MEASGLRRILDKLRSFNHPILDRQLDDYDSQTQFDLTELQENFDQDVLEDMSDPYNVLRAILSSVEGTRAQDFLISMLKHLLLIRQQGDSRVRYFQLIDRLVTNIVLDRKALDSDFAKVIGSSVADIASRFADQERLQQALEDLARLRTEHQQIQQEKEDLEEEASSSQGGVVGQLKVQLSRAEEDLRVSRQTSGALESRITNLEKTYREKEQLQEMQVQELFSMLKEARLLDNVDVDEGSILDRRELLALMEKKLERTKTFYALEGKTLEGQAASRSAKSSAKSQISTATRQSAFEDAEDEAVRQHIASRIAASTAELVRRISYSCVYCLKGV